MSTLADVNTTNLRSAIELACETMQRTFNADDNGIPFFDACAWPEPKFGFSSAHSESHVPGRHLAALLLAERVAGTSVAEATIERHRRAALFSYSGALPLPLNRERVDGPLVNFIPHNLREGFHALHALAAFRCDGAAAALVERSVRCALELWHPDGGWDRARIERHSPIELKYDDGLMAGIARAIGPLAKLYDATGSRGALKLAIRIKDKLLASAFAPDGSYWSAAMGTHTHSITCVMSSLAQLAEVTHDGSLLRRVRSFYDSGLWQLRDAIGWTPETTLESCKHGEVNATGDIVETALILGRRFGDEYFADAERVIRSHILPSQLRDTSFIPPSLDSVSDSERDIARRLRGAFGFPAPYGHLPVGQSTVKFNLDIVGGATLSLCEALLACSRFRDGCHWVDLLFDHKTPHITVLSPYDSGGLRFTVWREGRVLVRLPSGTRVIEVRAKGVLLEWQIVGSRLLVKPQVGVEVVVGLKLQMATVVLKDGRRTQLEGERVVAMESLDAVWTFFKPLKQPDLRENRDFICIPSKVL